VQFPTGSKLSLRPASLKWLIQWKSEADSIVWMGEDGGFFVVQNYLLFYVR